MSCTLSIIEEMVSLQASLIEERRSQVTSIPPVKACLLVGRERHLLPVSRTVSSILDCVEDLSEHSLSTREETPVLYLGPGGLQMRLGLSVASSFGVVDREVSLQVGS